MPVVADGKRYSPLDRESVHADMREDPERTRRAVAAQPGVKAAHRGCEECVRLDPVLAWAQSRRAKVIATLPELAAVLGLPPSAQPLRMFVTDDPQVLHLVFSDDVLDPVPLDQEAPYAQLVDDADEAA